MSNNGDGSNSSSPSSLFFSLSSYSRFLSQNLNLNPTMGSNNPEHGSNSSKPSSSSSLFLNLSSYSRFRRCRSLQASFSSSSDSIPHSRTSSIDSTPRDSIPILCESPPAPSVDSIPYSRLEITSALENSVSGRPPSSTSGCGNGKLALPCGSFKRCTLRNEKVVIFCRHIHFQKPDLSPSHLSTLTSRSHHPSIVKLLGASQSRYRSHIYMVYEDIPGATLKECLRNPCNNINPLSNWLWRMQVALDLAQGLDYIHHHCGMVHNKMTSSTVIVTEPNSNACIFLFGADKFRNVQIEGTIGYAAPEVFDNVIISQKSDVYAFGVVILELVSGKAAFKMKYRLVSLVETARKTFRREGEPEDEETRRGRVMQFVDPRLHNSFPMETAESLIQVALKCVADKPQLRPEMASVAEDIRRLFSDSKVWQTMKSPTTAFSLSSLLRSETKEGVPSEGKLLHYPSLEEKENPREEDS